MAHPAFHDALTGLPNRSLFMDRLTHALERSKRHNRDTSPRNAAKQVAVLFLDLDDFKVINDTLGHRAGDSLLIEVGKLIHECVRADDTIARLGGDEFTVLLEEVAGVRGAINTAERIITRLQESITIDERNVFINASIGIALSSAGQQDPEDLLREADVAMYEAKGTGKARYHVYDENLKSPVWQRLQLEFDLRRAIEREEFIVFYQPVFHLGTGEVTEVEALVRWNHPQRGLVPPAEFIPLAEETGFILPLGQWVLEQACRQMREWRKRRVCGPSMILSVNLSAKQFKHRGLLQDIVRTLKESKLTSGCLKLEITESAAMEGIDATLQTLQALRDLGIKLAIDDFGVGYSALSYLKRYPIDTLKLDRSFLENIERDPENSAIIRAIVAFASALNLTVTAEGIETAEQLSHVFALGCDYGQGYYFARPMPAAALAAFLQAQSNSQAVRSKMAPAPGNVSDSMVDNYSESAP